jgi:hypothetical protein
MGLALALIVLGILTLMDQMGKHYGFKEGWPWIIVALGVGRLYRNTRSIPGWITTLLGVLILGAKYYTLNIRFPMSQTLFSRYCSLFSVSSGSSCIERVKFPAWGASQICRKLHSAERTGDGKFRWKGKSVSVQSRRLFPGTT